MIQATCRTNDGHREVTFDATPWFEGVAAEDVRELAACDWGSHAAERLAISLMDNLALLELFRYPSCAGFGEVKFSCRVNPSQAHAWLRPRRRSVSRRGAQAEMSQSA